VFLSYSRTDAPLVKLFEEWLGAHGIRVIRDIDEFYAGADVFNNIVLAVGEADKVIVVHSANSRHRDWVGLERTLAEEVERGLESRKLLVYLCLDDSALPDCDKTRIAIRGEGRELDDIGRDVVHALENIGP
jgi:hypothetical protein